MGRSYILKGVSLPRDYTPSKGDKLFIEGRRTAIKRVYAVDNGSTPYVDFTRSVDGTTAMSVGNLRQVARLDTGGAE